MRVVLCFEHRAVFASVNVEAATGLYTATYTAGIPEGSVSFGVGQAARDLKKALFQCFRPRAVVHEPLKETKAEKMGASSQAGHASRPDSPTFRQTLRRTPRVTQGLLGGRRAPLTPSHCRVLSQLVFW